MAAANPTKLGSNVPVEKSKQVVQYFGEGADKVKFVADPNASLIRVYANGCILMDY
jgi:hypothetical protein